MVELAISISGSASWVDVLALFTTIVGIGGLGVGAFVAVRQLKDARSTSEMTALFQFTERYDALRESRQQIREFDDPLIFSQTIHGLHPASQQRQALLDMANFFEFMGLAARQGAISLELIDELWGSSILIYWEQYGPTVVKFRETDERAYEWFEDLNNHAKQRRREPHAHDHH